MRFLIAMMFGVFLLGLAGGAQAEVQPRGGECAHPDAEKLPVINFEDGLFHCVHRADMRLKQNGGPGVVDTDETTVKTLITSPLGEATAHIISGCITIRQWLTPAGEEMYRRLGTRLPSPRIRTGTYGCSAFEREGWKWQ